MLGINYYNFFYFFNSNIYYYFPYIILDQNHGKRKAEWRIPIALLELQQWPHGVRLFAKRYAFLNFHSMFTKLHIRLACVFWFHAGKVLWISQEEFGENAFDSQSRLSIDTVRGGFHPVVVLRQLNLLRQVISHSTRLLINLELDLLV